MTDYIKKDDALRGMRLVDDVTHIIAIQPADVMEVRHGRWELVDEQAQRYGCSECKHLSWNEWYDYCPYCGAKMDGGAE